MILAIFFETFGLFSGPLISRLIFYDKLLEEKKDVTIFNTCGLKKIFFTDQQQFDEYFPNLILATVWQFSTTFDVFFRENANTPFHNLLQKLLEKKVKTIFDTYWLKNSSRIYSLFFTDQQQFDYFFPPLILASYLAIFYNFWLLFCRVYTVVSPSPASVSLSTVACISVSTIPWSLFFWEPMHLFFGHSCWDGVLPSFLVRISFNSFK